MKQVWSCGGGVQSAAIAALIVERVQGELDALTDTDRAARYALETELQKHDPNVYLDRPNSSPDNGCQTGFCFT